MAAVTTTVILEPKQIKFPFFPIYLPWSEETRCHDLSFLNVVLSQLFHSFLSPSSKGSLVPLHFLPLGWYHLHIWGCWYFSQKSWFQLVIHQRQTVFLGSKITADSDCSHEIKRCLLLRRKVMTNLDSTLKSRDIILLTKVCIVKVMVFPVVMYECESWSIVKAEHQRIDAFKLCC